MDKLESNKLIAEFLGRKGKTQEHLYTFKGLYDLTNDCWSTIENTRFNSSWEWLMLVVEKIDLLLADDEFVTITYNRCLIDIYATSWIFPDASKEIDSLTIEGLGNTRLEATYNAVLEFIKWYNENK